MRTCSVGWCDGQGISLSQEGPNEFRYHQRGHVICAGVCACVRVCVCVLILVVVPLPSTLSVEE